jgi:hypothetical protein
MVKQGCHHPENVGKRGAALCHACDHADTRNKVGDEIIVSFVLGK